MTSQQEQATPSVLDCDNNECPVCLCSPSQELAFLAGPCDHAVCQTCMERILLTTTTTTRSAVTSEQSIPARGKCPICRSDIFLFELKMTKNGELAYQNDTKVAEWPIAGLVYAGLPPGDGPIFHFDGEVPAVQLLLEDDDLIHDETHKTPLDMYNWHEKSLTFHGTVQLDDEEGRRWRWDVILQFSSDLCFISNGVLFVKHLSDENNNRHPYPLDGHWEVQWEGGLRDEIFVRQNAFRCGQHRYMLDLSGDRPTFRWPFQNVVQTATEGAFLGAAHSQGQPVGSQVVWETSENERIIWRRKGDEHVMMRFGPGGRMYCRLDAGIRSPPTYCQDSLWGNTFCQARRVGLASYHFLSAEDGAYISYEHPLCAQWPPLDDGRPVPSQVYFKNVALDETERVFRGTIEWQEDYGTTWQGCSKWIYEMKFDSEYTCILSGVVKSISSGNQEQEMSTFGMDLVYINAAVKDMFQSLMSDDFDQYVRVSRSVMVRLETEGASNRTIVMMFPPQPHPFSFLAAGVS